MKFWQIGFLSMAIGSAQAQTLEIINHFGEDLVVKVTQGAEFLPGFSSDFTLSSGSALLTTVLRSGVECNATPFNPSAYLMVSGTSTQSVSAFMGVGLMCNSDAVEVSGFISHNIAFRWKNGDDTTVTFCKMEDYPC